MLPQIKEYEPLNKYTTFKIGGPARYFFEVRDELQLKYTLEFARDKNMPVFIMAGGSNILFADEGYPGVVVKLQFRGVSIDGENVTVASGVNLKELVFLLSRRKLSGMQNLCGIPGSVGGAVFGNAGAFGTEMKDVVKFATALNTETGERKTFSNKEMEFAYRESYFKKNPQWVVVTVLLKLEKVNFNVEKEAQKTLAEREKRHLQDVQAAGSFFKNPQAPEHVIEMFEKDKGVKSRGGRVPAGWLIEKAGLKGFSVGDAQSSLQHPNYIINKGGATASDVLKVKAKIEEEVFKQFQVKLEPEVRVVV